jgi:hypothetical protein
MDADPDAERADLTTCRQCRENGAEQGSEYCTVCLVMFAMLERGSLGNPS